MPRHGFRFIVQWASETQQRRWTTVLICALALVALALLVVPWNQIFPAVANPEPAPVAHIQPAPSPSPTSVIQVSGEHGAVCIVPTSKAKRPLTLVKVP